MIVERTYIYTGPVSAVTLPADNAHPRGRHVQFHPGHAVTLPDDNAYVRGLIARGYLTVDAKMTAPAAKTPVPEPAKNSQTMTATAAPAEPAASAKPTAAITGGAATVAVTGTGV